MKILIVTSPIDIHGAAVAWGLRKLGVTPVRWFASDFPRLNQSSFAIEPGGRTNVDFVIDGQRHEAPFGAIWMRRTGWVAPRASSHPHDIKVITSEANDYRHNVFSFLADTDCFWLNRLRPGRRGENKIFQLTSAQAVGFRMPNTLISNDPERVRAFYRDNGGRIIYKAFSTAGWVHENGNFSVLQTTALREEDLADDEVLRACPGIYQERIDKAYELRVTVIGDKVVTGWVDSQSRGETLDWRYDFMEGHKTIAPFDLPLDIRDRCIALCRRMELEFACIDLIVTPDGEHVFLELNQAGQFLWKEEADPRMRMLDIFCQHLASQGKAPYSPRADIGMAQFIESKDFAQFRERQDNGFSNDPDLLVSELPRKTELTSQ